MNKKPKHIEQYIEYLQKAFKNSLVGVILYGSYARGENNADSDVDIMILLDMNDDSLSESIKILSEITYEFNVNNDIYVSPIMENNEVFNKMAEYDPFYYNVRKDGVYLYGAA